MGQIGERREGGCLERRQSSRMTWKEGGKSWGERREGLSAGDSGGRERLSPAFLLESKSQGRTLAR